MSYQSLEKTIHYSFRKPELLYQALTHPSYVAEYPDCQVDDNQRLEFLGDAVIALIISRTLYDTFPQAAEGKLSQLRAMLSKEQSLAVLARQIHLGTYLRLGRGEQKRQGHERDSILCDAFEALIGAMYLDSQQDLTIISSLINQLIKRKYPTLDDKLLTWDNSKGSLQEWSQHHLSINPDYRLIHVRGADHQREYTVEVWLNEKCYGIGKASKRQRAEQQAATEALKSIKNIHS